MKRTLVAVALAAAVPLTAGAVALGQMSPDVIDPGVAAGTGSTPTGVEAPPSTSRSVVLQAGSTRRVVLGKVNSGTGYAWKWMTRPETKIARGYPVQMTRAKKNMPGAARTAYVRILGLAEDMKTTGKLGLYAPGDQTTPTRTINLTITVTGDGR